uniref:Uncharacterized protein n=1 Tax=Arundo donax TaxID=35708 RepID=A0A0A8ZJB1_ARUDO
MQVEKCYSSSVPTGTNLVPIGTNTIDPPSSDSNIQSSFGKSQKESESNTVFVEEKYKR